MISKRLVHPSHNKECKTEKCNYKPSSISQNLSKIYERLDQMYTDFDNFL